MKASFGTVVGRGCSTSRGYRDRYPYVGLPKATLIDVTGLSLQTSLTFGIDASNSLSMEGGNERGTGEEE